MTDPDAVDILLVEDGELKVTDAVDGCLPSEPQLSSARHDVPHAPARERIGTLESAHPGPFGYRVHAFTPRERPA